MACERRLIFGDVAELYDQSRPSYPHDLVEDVLGLVPGRGRPEVLEVGAGTGKATVLFASRDASILALEPSPGMATIAERNCARYPKVVIERAEFERWEPAGRTFELVLSAQAWHWLSPEIRTAKARGVLRNGGALAAFWNRVDWDQCQLAPELGDVYADFAPELERGGPNHPGASTTPDEVHAFGREVRASTGLTDPEVRRYPWRRVYRTAEWVRLLQTHSDHAVLAPDRRGALLGAVAGVIDAAGGELELSYVTVLCLARAC